jgi:phosphatidylglycerophosphate synthase
VLDCADGNMARTIGKKSLYGSWADASGGYIAYATELFSIGMTSYLANGDSFAGLSLPWGSATWIIVASFAAIANLLMRLLYQSMKNVELAAGLVPAPGREKRFSEEIGITGYLPFLYGAGLASGWLPVVLVIYAAIYAGGFAVTALKQVRKVTLSSR